MSLENIEAYYPLSPMQQGMLFHSIYPPTADIYIVQWDCLLQGNFNPSAFKQAWQQALNRHSILRTAFVWEGTDEPLQVVGRQVELPWQHYDWRDRSTEAQQERLATLLQAERVQGFELMRAPLMNCTLIQVDDDSYRFIWSFHHLLLDGWSVSLLIEEVFASYEDVVRGNVVPPDPVRPYGDYIAWLQQQNMAEASDFWHHYLAGFTDATSLPIRGRDEIGSLHHNTQIDEPIRGRDEIGSLHHADTRDMQGDDSSFAFGRQALSLSQETTSALLRMAQRQHLTLNTLLQGAWALLLSRYSGQDDVVFGVTVSGRPASLTGVEEMMGLFINTLPLRVGVQPETLLYPWLQELQAQQYDVRQYEYTPLVQIHAQSDVPAGRSLFESILVFENYPQTPASPDQEVTLQSSDSSLLERTNYPLALVVAPSERILLELLYESTRFDAATIQRMLGHLQALLEGFLAQDEHTLRLRDVPLLSKSERAQLLVEWNQTTHPYPSDSSLPHLFEEQVAHSPDAIAVVYEQQHITYADLNRRANQLAHTLCEAGVGLDHPVALYLERSPMLIIATLAILKAGGAYLPLDLNAPQERLATMLADSQATLLLTQQSLSSALPFLPFTPFCLDTLWPSIIEHATGNLNLPLRSDMLAYVMYTSGSTGIPKGVCIPQCAVARLVLENTFAHLTATERFLQLAPISFDAATLEIWGALLHGARLVLFPSLLPALADIDAILRQEQITILWLTSGLFHQMVDHHLSTLSQVPQLLSGGDVLSVPHVQKFLQTGEGHCLINGYGPTENTTFTCCYPMQTLEQVGATISIGRPIANTRVYVLDADFQPVPIGIAGELYTGGDGLARGYLNHPSLTAEKFVPDPFSGEVGARLYRIGDMVRYLPDGTLEFLGRRDQQVKLHGFRIELGEIEAALAQHHTISKVVVLAREDTPGDKRLVAYVVPELQQEIVAQDLRIYLGQQLPSYMVPAIYETLDELPLTRNGKIDRQALPVPGQPDLRKLVRYVVASTPTEQLLTEIWQQVLGVEHIGTQDNFFELGGDSILGISILARANQAGLPFTLKHLFQYQTIAALALVAEEEAAQQAEQQAIDTTSTSKSELVDLDAEAFKELMSELSEVQE